MCGSRLFFSSINIGGWIRGIILFVRGSPMHIFVNFYTVWFFQGKGPDHPPPPRPRRPPPPTVASACLLSALSLRRLSQVILFLLEDYHALYPLDSPVNLMYGVFYHFEFSIDLQSFKVWEVHTPVKGGDICIEDSQLGFWLYCANSTVGPGAKTYL